MKLKIKKGIKALGLCTILVAGSATITGCSKSFEDMREEMKTEVVNRGFASQNIYFGTTKEESTDYEFSLVDCGNYKIGYSVFAEEMLLDKTLPTGIVINSTSDTLASMYKEIDRVKEIISMYDVEYPVFLNVDLLYEVNNNDQELVQELVETFYTKLSANGCYSCVMGTKEHLNSLNNIGVQDQLVVLNGDSLSENDEYKMVLIDGDILVSSIKFNKIITDNNFNTKERLVEDYSYNLIEGDTVYSLATNTDIDEMVLCEYNEIDDPTTLQINREVIFPNIYGDMVEQYNSKVKALS